MHRKFIALIVATAIAITGLSAAPARADNDVAKFLAGLAAIALIGAAIENRRRDDTPIVSRSTVDPRPNPVRPRPLPRHLTRYDLPAKCLRSYSTRDGTRRLLSRHCLSNNYRHWQQLPYACQLGLRDGRGSQTGYEPVCLRERGYRLVNR